MWSGGHADTDVDGFAARQFAVVRVLQGVLSSAGYSEFSALLSERAGLGSVSGRPSGPGIASRPYRWGSPRMTWTFPLSPNDEPVGIRGWDSPSGERQDRPGRDVFACRPGRPSDGPALTTQGRGDGEARWKETGSFRCRTHRYTVRPWLGRRTALRSSTGESPWQWSRLGRSASTPRHSAR